ncbi:MAG: hypothetical protein WBG92_20185 [Thiohalocapsa sp.]
MFLEDLEQRLQRPLKQQTPGPKPQQRELPHPRLLPAIRAELGKFYKLFPELELLRNLYLQTYTAKRAPYAPLQVPTTKPDISDANSPRCPGRFAPDLGAARGRDWALLRLRRIGEHAAECGSAQQSDPTPNPFLLDSHIASGLLTLVQPTEVVLPVQASSSLVQLV